MPTHNTRFGTNLTEKEEIRADELRAFLWANKFYPNDVGNSRYSFVKFCIMWILENEEFFVEYELFKDVARALINNGRVDKRERIIPYILRWTSRELKIQPRDEAISRANNLDLGLEEIAEEATNIDTNPIYPPTPRGKPLTNKLKQLNEEDSEEEETEMEEEINYEQ